MRRGGPSDERLPRDANAICAEAERKIEALPAPATVEGFEPFLRRGLQISKRYDRRFRALEPPPELRDQHRRAGRLSRRAERLVESLLDDLESGRPSLENAPPDAAAARADGPREQRAGETDGAGRLRNAAYAARRVARAVLGPADGQPTSIARISSCSTRTSAASRSTSRSSSTPAPKCCVDSAPHATANRRHSSGPSFP
jgi:hypothetical protein